MGLASKVEGRVTARAWDDFKTLARSEGCSVRVEGDVAFRSSKGGKLIRLRCVHEDGSLDVERNYKPKIKKTA